MASKRQRKANEAKERLACTVRGVVAVTDLAIVGARSEAKAAGVSEEESREIVLKILERIERRNQ